MKNSAVTLDVREDIRQGREPFSRIMSAAATLELDQQLVLIAPFEPVPLYAVLGKQGFHHSARQITGGDWEVCFTPGAGEQPVVSAPATSSVPQTAKVVEVDARGLEPPQPMVKILEALATLPSGAELRALTDRRPMHLYAQLTDRGFGGETHEQPNGNFITLIRRV
jgi:uncharacterized protein (DUF2249 family)